MSTVGKVLVGGLVAVNIALVGLLFFRDRAVEPARAGSAPVSQPVAVAPAVRPVEQITQEPVSEPQPPAEQPAVEPEPEPVTERSATAAPERQQPPASVRTTKPAAKSPAKPRPATEGPASRESTRVASSRVPETRLPSDTWPAETARTVQDPEERDARQQPARVPPPAQPARPRIRTIPAGTSMVVKLGVAVHSREVQAGDRFEASLAQSINVGGETVASAGAAITGRIVEVIKAGKTKGREQMKLALDTITIAGRSYDLDSSTLALEAEGDGGRDATTIGGAAAAGAVLGAIMGGGDGMAKGAAVGAAAGTGVVMSTRGRPIELESGSRLDFLLESSVQVTMPTTTAPRDKDRDYQEEPAEPAEPRRDAGTGDENVARRF